MIHDQSPNELADELIRWSHVETEHAYEDEVHRVWREGVLSGIVAGVALCVGIACLVYGLRGQL
jgi:hypothetical protein